MPVQARPSDTFTRDNLLLGFSIVEFEPALAGGGYGAAVPLGILSGEALQKEIEILELERGDSGFLTVDREVVSRLKPSLQLETFNLRSDIARYVFGSDVASVVTADAAAAVVNEEVVVPSGADAPRTFVTLDHGDIDDVPAANLTLTCAPIVAEIVPHVTGDGTVDGDYRLAFKPLVLGDVTLLRELTSAGVLVRTFTVQAGEPAAATEAQLVVGTGATSGNLDLFQAVAAGNYLEATYTPSHNLVEDVNAVNPDMVIDPLLGRIRFPNIDSFAAPAATTPIRQGQTLHLDYIYNRHASVTLQPFRQNQFEGRATVKHLPDIGINFIWTIPSVTLRITDDDLTFGADDFATATLIMNINDAGGTDRFGTLAISSETESAA